VYIEDSDGPVIVSQAGVVAALVLFAALVLVPHVPAEKRQPFRLAGVVALPLLAMLPAALIALALNSAAEAFIDGYVPLAVEEVVAGIASGSWVIGLGVGLTWIAGLQRSGRLWRNLAVMALGVAGLVFLFCHSFCLFFCSKWDDPLLALSGTLLILGTPIGLTTALYSGLADSLTLD